MSQRPQMTQLRLDLLIFAVTQLQLVQNKFIKIIVIVLLGKNNEPCEGELRNFIRKYMGICIEYIPDRHANITFLFLETTLSATVFKMESQNFLYLY